MVREGEASLLVVFCEAEVFKVVFCEADGVAVCKEYNRSACSTASIIANTRLDALNVFIIGCRATVSRP